ncbi:MAG: DHH family phosphoesterase [Erysipelotrichaceae bacterium]
MERLENFKVQIGILIIAQVLSVVVIFILGYTGLGYGIAAYLIIDIAIVVWIMYRFEQDKTIRDIDISRILGSDAKDALIYGEIGIITYDENYNVTWINDFLESRNLNIIGKKATNWLPEINELFQGDVDVIEANDGTYMYEVTRKENAQVLYIKDVSRYNELKYRYTQEGLVVGLLHLDNYMEVSQYEDEAKISLINTNLRQPLVDWAKKHGMFIRRLRSDRYLIILDEKIYQEIVEDHFSILNTIRIASGEIEAAITLSMAFARGSKDLRVLDAMVNDVLELAQSRGGDQVAIRKYGDDVKFFGGNTEAPEKRSRVRVRVMSQAIKEAILEAENVFIVGHKNMDFDCMGSALFMSSLVQAYDKKAYIVSTSGGIEQQLAEAMHKYQTILNKRHKFISDGEALKTAKSGDLVIAVDHHNPSQSNAPEILSKLDKVIVIDHHRRSEDFIYNPLLVYVESAASSVSELVVEFIPYQTNKLHIYEEEATIMYLGILIDTNRFKTRTGSRTFEAAASLKKLGVDPITAEGLLKESFDDVAGKTLILKYAKMYGKNIVIAALKEETVVTRTLMSQVADYLLTIKGIEASFVIAKDGPVTTAISARSTGLINVQVIMESMHGGGHFTAAALQRVDTTVDILEKECKEMIDSYLKEEKQNESNTNK